MRRRRYRSPAASVAEPRPILLAAVCNFVRAVRRLEGIRRIALVGSLATAKPVPKDADVLVELDSGFDLRALAGAGRRLKGAAQGINLGADIFLADETGAYLGRLCLYKECHPRAACYARNCGGGDYLKDDLEIVTMSPGLIAAPPAELWPEVIRRGAIPGDVEKLLLAELIADAGTF